MRWEREVDVALERLPALKKSTSRPSAELIAFPQAKESPRAEGATGRSRFRGHALLLDPGDCKAPPWFDAPNLKQ